MYILFEEDTLILVPKQISSVLKILIYDYMCYFCPKVGVQF